MSELEKMVAELIEIKERVSSMEFKRFETNLKKKVISEAFSSNQKMTINYGDDENDGDDQSD